jgi:hypothetical protein
VASRGAGDLQIDEDHTHQRQQWVVERVGRGVLALLIVAALAGLFGSGPLSHAVTEVPDLLRVEYQRFTRYEDPETLVLRVGPAATASGRVRVSLSRDFLDKVKIDSVVPAPEISEGAEDRVVYTFRVAEPGRPLVVSYDVTAQQFGRIRGRARLEDGNLRNRELHFSQLAYP